MSRKFLLTFATVLLLVGIMSMSIPAAAQKPAQSGAVLTYSSTLTDPAGNAVTDGPYDFIFTLYASEKDSQPLWSETQSGVPLKSGNLDIQLGQSIAIPDDVASLKDLWVAVSVRGPQDSDFTLLNPRHNLKAPDTVSALNCPHDHFTDSWSGANPEMGLLLENTSVGDGLRAYSKSTTWNYAAIFGANIATTGYGTGVYGYSEKGVGIYANSANGDALEATTSSTTKSAIYAHAIDSNGVWGISTNKQGVHGGSTNNFGVEATGGGDSNAYDKIGDLLIGGARGEIFAPGTVMNLFSNGWVAIDLDNDNNGSHALEIWNGTDVLVFKVDEAGNTTATGTKSASVNTANYGERLMYSVESPEVWFEDFGTAYLKDGAVTVSFDPIFAETVDLMADYHVYVTPICEEAVVLFVTAKTTEGFTVKGVTLSNQPSGCAFDYRVVANRLGYESTRLAPADVTTNSKNGR